MPTLFYYIHITNIGQNQNIISIFFFIGLRLRYPRAFYPAAFSHFGKYALENTAEQHREKLLSRKEYTS